MGIKYNAISCDSCRVFFRRVVLIKDRDPSRDTWSKCTLPHLRHRLPNKSEHSLKLRCQHCRLLMCYASGMADHFIASKSQIRVYLFNLVNLSAQELDFTSINQFRNHSMWRHFCEISRNKVRNKGGLPGTIKPCFVTFYVHLTCVLLQLSEPKC